MTRQGTANMEEAMMNRDAQISNANGNGNGKHTAQQGDVQHQNKRAKKSNDTNNNNNNNNEAGEMYLSAEMLVEAAAVLSSLPMTTEYSSHKSETESALVQEKESTAGDKADTSSSGSNGKGEHRSNGKDSSSSGSNGSNGNNDNHGRDDEDEYVCVVRMRENSPVNPGENFPASALSKASMRDHDRTSGQDRTNRGSPSSGSTGSGSSGSRDTGSRSTGSSAFPVSSNETGKNSTSSETGSEENSS